MAIRLRQRDSTSDLIKLIKENYTAPKETTDDRRVTCRSKNTYIIERLPGHWDRKYERRCTNLERGHFRPGFLPYETIGDINLDAGELTLSKFADGIPDEVIEQYQKRNQHVPLKFIPERDQAQHSQKGGGDAEAEDKGTSRAVSTAGMVDIKAMLDESRKRITSVKAGQAYMNHLADCQRERARLQALEAQPGDLNMELQRLSSNLLRTPLRAQSADLWHNEADSNNGGDSLRGTKYIILQSSKSNRKPNRKLQAFLNKLDCIYTLLSSLLNMKSKQLRTKLPLTLETVTSLRTIPPPLGYARRMSMIGGSRMHPNRSEMSRLDVKTRASFQRTSITDSKDVDHSKSAHGTASSNPPTQPKKFCFFSKNLLMGKKTKNFLSMLKDPDTVTIKVETWDDLLAAGSGKTRAFRNIFKKAVPWSTNAGDNKSSCHKQSAKSGETTDESDHKFFDLEDFIAEQKKGKEQIRKQALLSLAKIEREKGLKCARVLDSLCDLNPLWEEQCRILDKVSHDISFDPDVIMQDETITWFENLQQEAKGQKITTDQSNTVEDALAKLRTLCKYDFNSVTFVKEKLCLLTVSLPVFELCTTHMQHAVKFIISDVLQLNECMLSQWLQHRGLPLFV